MGWWVTCIFGTKIYKWTGSIFWSWWNRCLNTRFLLCIDLFTIHIYNFTVRDICFSTQFLRCFREANFIPSTVLRSLDFIFNVTSFFNVCSTLILILIADLLSISEVLFFMSLDDTPWCFLIRYRMTWDCVVDGDVLFAYGVDVVSPFIYCAKHFNTCPIVAKFELTFRLSTSRNSMHCAFSVNVWCYTQPDDCTVI